MAWNDAPAVATGQAGGQRPEGIGYRVLRVLENGLRRSGFDDLPPIHDRYAMTDALHHRDIMRYEDKGDAVLLLQFQHQIGDLARAAQAAAIEPVDPGVIERNGSGGRFHRTKQGASQCRFSAAGFADKTQGLVLA